MKIVIDCRFWGPKHTGLGIYTQNLVENLAKIDRENKYVLLLRPEDFDLTSFPENFSKQKISITAYSLKEQLVMPWILYRLNPDIVHFPSINVPILYLGRYLVTVHDLIKHFFRGPLTTTRNHGIYWLKFISYLLVFRWIVFWSRLILVPSKTVKDELHAQFAIAYSKVKVTYEASVIDVSSKSTKTSLSLPKKFAIYTGNAYPHKNLDRLIRVWKKIYSQTNTELVIVGGRSVFAKRIETLIGNEKADSYIKQLGYVPPEELPFVYRQASLYVFPSLSEGFGLPGLDAMKIGLPLVCSDIPVLREVYGDAANYFDPKSETSIVSAVVDALTDKKLRNVLIAKGQSQSGLYSWEKTARGTLEAYRAL